MPSFEICQKCDIHQVILVHSLPAVNIFSTTVTVKNFGLLLDRVWIWLDFPDFKHDYVKEVYRFDVCFAGRGPRTGDFHGDWHNNAVLQGSFCVCSMHPASETQCYTVMSSPVGWAHTQNDSGSVVLHLLFCPIKAGGWEWPHANIGCVVTRIL